MITKNTFFNNASLNIFTDASIKTIDDQTVTCAGATFVVTNDGIPSISNFTYEILCPATNNIGELKAIRLGIIGALQYRQFYKNINLFSDSNISVKALTTWIYNWVKNKKQDVLYNTSGAVINQDIICDIINIITTNNLSINIYHQKGHINENDISSLNYAIQVFNRENSTTEYIDIELMKILARYNNYVDIKTKELLQNINKDDLIKLTPQIDFRLNCFDESKYRNLLNNNRKK